MAIAFQKYEGLGNDFIVVDWSDPTPAPALAERLCDRHFGIGADGLLLVMPAAGAAVARMLVINADGSRPEMCGNGLRCVALHLKEQRGLGSEFVVETDAGPRACTVLSHPEPGQAEVRISLGTARFQGEHMGRLPRGEIRFELFSLGNPHAVCFEAGLDEAEIDDVGPRISAQLPGGSNVEFARLARPEGSLDVIVWERGVGRTLACGTGAGATVAAAARLGMVPYDTPVRVRLPGGALAVAVSGADQEVVLEGPTRRVFAGEMSR